MQKCARSAGVRHQKHAKSARKMPRVCAMRALPSLLMTRTWMAEHVLGRATRWMCNTLHDYFLKRPIFENF